MKSALLFVAMLLLSSSALAEDEVEGDYTEVEVIHSDLPLYGFD